MPMLSLLVLVTACSTSVVSNRSFNKVEWQKAIECAPANITKTRITKLEDPKFHFGLASFQNVGVANGPVYQLSKDNSFDYQGTNYQVSTLRLVAPSSHQIVGSSFLLEIQFFAVSKDNQPLALSVFVKKGEENSTLLQLIKNQLSEINLGDLLPKYAGHYSYMGALPSPNCYQVKWIIMKSAISASVTDLEAYLKEWPTSTVQAVTIEPIFETE